MAYIRLPGGIKVALEYEVFGKVVVNVYHVTTTDPILTAKLVDITEIFRDWFINEMAQGFSQDLGLTAVTALNLDVANGEKVTTVVSPPALGDLLTEAVPNNVAIVASLGTDLTGRSFRGRSYHAGLDEPSVAANEIGTSLAAFFVASYAILQVILGSNASLLVVASFQTAGAPRAVGIGTPVTNVSMNVRVDTQRRRLPR